MTRVVAQVAEDVDYESIEREIAVEPRSASDARIAKFVLDGGPGNIIRTYDLGGIDGTYRVPNECGRAKLEGQHPESQTMTIRSPDSTVSLSSTAHSISATTNRAHRVSHDNESRRDGHNRPARLRPRPIPVTVSAYLRPRIRRSLSRQPPRMVAPLQGSRYP